MSVSLEVAIGALGRWLGGAMIGSGPSDVIFEALVKTVGAKVTPREPIDVRLARIELARTSLSSALTAMDELKAEAEQNAAQVEALKLELGKVSEKHAVAESELTNIRELAKLDAATVKKVMGVPTARAVWTERLIGFALGIVGSIFASWMWETFLTGLLK